jgi:EmrB/QacA subfamily drug resistance transporter
MATETITEHRARRRTRAACSAEHRPIPKPKPSHLRATLILACLAQFMVILDVSVVNVALPSIGTALHFSETDLQWVVNAYTVTFGGFLLLGGRAADLLGRRRVFVAGLALFALTSLVCGVADSRVTLIAARAVQGLSAAVIAPASLSILTHTFRDGPARNRAVGIWGAMGGAGGAAGVLLGGIITQALSWRWIFFINLPIGLGAALLTQYYVAALRDTSQTRSFDLRGAVSATLGLTLLVLGIVRTGTIGWGSPQTIATLGAGIILIGGFLAIEGRFASAPLMPLRIFRSRTLTAANLVVFTIGAASFAMWYFLTLYLQQVQGFSPLKTGLTFLPMTLSIVAGSTIASRLVGRVGAKRLLVTGMALQAIGLLLLNGISAGGSYVGELLVPSLLVALGIGLAFVSGTISAVNGVPSHEAGLASGIVNTARMVGGALGLAVLAAVATSKTNEQVKAAGAHPTQHVLHVALTSGFELAFVVAGVFAAAGAAISLFGLPRISRRAAAQPEVAVESA